MVDIYKIVSVLVLQIFRKKGMHIFKVLENQKSVTIEIYLLNVILLHSMGFSAHLKGTAV